MGAGGEFDAIRLLLDRWGVLASGIGDDAAVLDPPPGERVIATTDTAIERVHFERKWMSPREIGWRAVASAVSDVAAMGARALGILFALGVPPSWRAELGDLASGLGDACGAFGVPIVGGNLAVAGELSITSTVVGSARAPIPRSGARPGDEIFVTGRLGGPRLAIEALLAGRRVEPEHRERLVRPEPRLREGRWLAEAGVSAMIDVSDGLAADLAHLAAASGVRLVVDVREVPAVPGVEPMVALGSGEEYELACAAPAGGAIDVAAFGKIFGLPLTRIGRVESGEGELVLLNEGVRVAPPAGHDHFSS